MQTHERIGIKSTVKSLDIKLIGKVKKLGLVQCIAKLI